MSDNVAILNEVTKQFLDALRHDTGIINVAATRVFYYLAVIQLSFTTLWMVVGGESLQRFLGKLVQLAFSFGFFYALIQHGGHWIPDLLNGFIDIGKSAGVQSLNPSAIIEQGISISGAIFNAFAGWGALKHLFVAMIGSVVCISVLIIYGFIAAELTIVLVKAYILITVGSLFFAFGASDYTRDMAINYFRAIIGLGLKLMTLYLILGVGNSIGAQWATLTHTAAQAHEIIPLLVILCAVIVYYLVLKNIPPFIAALAGIGGFRNYGDAAVGLAIDSGFKMSSSMMNAWGMSGKGAQALTEFGKGAASVGKSIFSGSHASNSGVIRLGRGFKKAAFDLMNSGANTLKDMACRENQHLTFGQKLNSHFSNRVRSHRQ